MNLNVVNLGGTKGDRDNRIANCVRLEEGGHIQG